MRFPDQIEGNLIGRGRPIKFPTNFRAARKLEFFAHCPPRVVVDVVVIINNLTSKITILQSESLPKTFMDKNKEKKGAMVVLPLPQKRRNKKKCIRKRTLLEYNRKR